MTGKVHLSPRQVVEGHTAIRFIAFQRGYWDKLSFLRANGLPLPSE